MIYSIQYFRAFAALFIVGHHIGTKCVQEGLEVSALLGFFDLGAVGTDMSFVISGFILFYVNKFSVGSFSEATKFFVRRILRIYPLYFALTLIALFIFLISPGSINKSSGGTNVVGSFFLFPADYPFLVANGWTLSYEFYFYFIFSIGLLFGRFWCSLFVVAVLFMLGSVGFFYKSDYIFVNFLFSSMLFEFLIGALVYFAFYFKYVRNTPLVLAVVFFLISIFLLSSAGERHSELRVFQVGLPCGLLLFAVLRFEELLTSLPSRLILFLAKISFSLFLSHPFVLAGLALIYDFRLIGTFFSFVVFFFSSIAFAFVCYIWCERPLSNYIRRHIASV